MLEETEDNSTGTTIRARKMAVWPVTLAVPLRRLSSFHARMPINGAGESFNLNRQPSTVLWREVSDGNGAVGHDRLR